MSNAPIPPFDAEMESLLAAATNEALLSTKAEICAMGYSEQEKQILCNLLEGLFRLGFCRGVAKMGEATLKQLGEGLA